MDPPPSPPHRVCTTVTLAWQRFNCPLYIADPCILVKIVGSSQESCRLRIDPWRGQELLTVVARENCHGSNIW